MKTYNHISMQGVNTHNLKDINVSIPKDKLVVVTGVSGSGKSSLIIDTLFNYSKSLYIGALSSKSFDMGEGDFQVERIYGTQPPVALKQSVNRLTNPRSTIGTITGMDGLFRLLFAHGGSPVCPSCYSDLDGGLFCEACGCYGDPLSPKHFSPNRKEGKCLQCNGLGKLIAFSEDLIVPDKAKSLTWIWDNAEPNTFSIPNLRKTFEVMCQDEGIDMNAPYSLLNDDQRKRVLYGTDKAYTIKVGKITNDIVFPGIIGYQESSYKKTTSATRQKAFERYIGEQECCKCKGSKLRPESMAVSIKGLKFNDCQELAISEIVEWLVGLLQDRSLAEHVMDLAEAIINQGRNIENVGLGYLSLNRVTGSLSGGELQRILLAQHLASDLSGVMYVLDEPTIGLHEQDTVKLLRSIQKLRDLGNSVIVIEHDETIIRAADWIIEIGPGAGSKGGEVVFEGSFDDLVNCDRSVTGKYLGMRQKSNLIEAKMNKWITFKNLTRHNLAINEVAFPINALTCVTGVSGSGKSSLISSVYDQLLSSIAAKKEKTAVKDITYVEQKPIGRSSRSTVATYLGINDFIRDIFADSDMAKEAGMDKKYFSSNVQGGRCETCNGQGYIELDMAFFKNETMVCGDCDGKKFQPPVLDVRVEGKNIHEILMMTVEDAIAFFSEEKYGNIYKALSYLMDFGLGYIVLGSSTTTLSGGEAQRLNLVTELLKRRIANSLFIFDEPTRGLHFSDIRYLLVLFERLLQDGHTIIIIEHNLDVISQAHWIVDIGPGGGKNGGKVVFSGKVAELGSAPESATGKYVQNHLRHFYAVKTPEAVTA